MPEDQQYQPPQFLADQECMGAMRAALQKLRAAKPDDRSELARRYAVAITEMEKTLAYFHTFVVTAIINE